MARDIYDIVYADKGVQESLATLRERVYFMLLKQRSSALRLRAARYRKFVESVGIDNVGPLQQTLHVVAMAILDARAEVEAKLKK